MTDGSLPDHPGYVAYAIASLIFIFLMYLFAKMIVLIVGSALGVARVASSPLVWLYRLVRRRRRTAHPLHLCRNKSRAGGRVVRCQEARYRFHARFLAPYCRDHMNSHRLLRCEAARRFDNDRFPYAENYFRDKPNCDRLVEEAVAEAERRSGRSKAGFLYVYVSAFDLDEQRVDLDKLEENETFFYKIGLTERTPYQRIREQAGAVFPSGDKYGVEGQDYFRVDDVVGAEKIAHARLCAVRYRRFDQEDAAFEKEWFLTTYGLVNDVMKRSADIVNKKVFSWK